MLILPPKNRRCWRNAWLPGSCRRWRSVCRIIRKSFSRETKSGVTAIPGTGHRWVLPILAGFMIEIIIVRWCAGPWIGKAWSRAWRSGMKFQTTAGFLRFICARASNIRTGILLQPRILSFPIPMCSRIEIC